MRAASSGIAILVALAFLAPVGSAASGEGVSGFSAEARHAWGDLVVGWNPLDGASAAFTLGAAPVEGAHVDASARPAYSAQSAWSVSGGATIVLSNDPSLPTLPDGGRDCVAVSTSLSFSVSLASCYRTLP